MSGDGSTRGRRGGLARRRFAQLALGGAALVPLARRRDAHAASDDPRWIIPPVDAEELTSACAFCIVGCGYRIFRWPLDAKPGGLLAAENALGLDFPTRLPSMPWISPNMHNVVDVEGVPHHVVVLPDWEARVVNIGGDHTLGGALARRLYSSADPDKTDRLLRPQLRVGDELVEIEWEDAIEIVAKVGRHVIDTHGESAWGMKTYSYQFYENTYAITKLAFEAVETPCWAPHDQPRTGSSTPGLSVAGVDAFSAGYPDWANADVVLLSGVAVYEARGVLFSGWVSQIPGNGATALVDDEGRSQKALIVINPRRDIAAQWAEERGGLHLQLHPGTDTVLNNAIARVILERGWHDSEFIEAFTVTEEELATEAESNARRAAYGMTFEQWRSMIESDERYSLAAAESVTGVPAEKIEAAAALLAQPRTDTEGVTRRPRASLMLEKGNYWSHNFPNSASLVSLGLLVGAGNRPGRVISRGGGHQRGMVRAARYPLEKSPDTLEGEPAGLNLDRWVIEGNLRMAWAIGCTWSGGGAASASLLFERMRTLTRTGPQLDESEAFPAGRDGGLDVDRVVARLNARADEGGMVLVQQDIYPHDGGLTELADVLLPAASWGEDSFCRMQGERRLRNYAKVCDAPGEARSDWAIVGSIATAMGYEGFSWQTSDEVLEEAAAVSGGAQAYGALADEAQRQERPLRSLLAERGTEGYQGPLYVEDGELKETARYHDADEFMSSSGGRGGFSTSSGKAIFARGSWDDVAERQEFLAPRADELWVLNGRDSRTWSAMIEDRRIGHRREQLPEHRLEISPTDAERLGLRDGDPIEVRNDTVGDSGPAPIQGQGGRFFAVAAVSDRVLPGVTFAYFNYGGEVSSAANNVVSATTDPINGMYSFKLGRGTIRRR